MTPGARPLQINAKALVLAIVLMLGVGALVSTSVVKLLRALGFFPPPRPPVEVFYEPYSDGKRLEDLLGPDELPGELEVWEVADPVGDPLGEPVGDPLGEPVGEADPASAPALPEPEPAAEPPPDSPQPPRSPTLPEPS